MTAGWGVDGRPTLNSVARQAGVSRQTVSNVLNSPDIVTAATREKVLAAIRDQGYRPHNAARQLRTHRSHVLGLRIEPVRDGIGGVLLDRFLHALTATAAEHHYRIMLFAAEDDVTEIAAYQELVSSIGVDAFVLTSTHHGDTRTRWLRGEFLPFVTFGRPWGAEDEHPWVDVDGAAGTEAAVAHLVSLGHQRIAFVGWPAHSGVGDDRRAGWRRGMAAAGLRGDDLSVEVPDGIGNGRTAVAALLARAQPPTAFVCASDSLAVGAVTELGQRGRTPGVDASVVGFDDTPTAAALDISSVAQPVAEVASQCVRLLSGVLHREPGTPRPQPVLLPPHLVPRGSSGPLHTNPVNANHSASMSTVER